MSAPDRRGRLDRDRSDLSVRRQCVLLGVARSSVYRPPRPANDNDLMLMRRIDELFTAWPFLGSRRLTVLLRAEGYSINRKRVRRLMRRMGISALAPKPKTTKPAPGHKIFPYLLRDLVIDRPNQVWAADITYIPIGRGFLYLVAIIDWASRAVLSWRLSNTMDVSFLCFGAGGGVGPLRQTRDIQYRPRQSVHQRCVHRNLGRCQNPNLDGWQRPLDGQRFYRTPLALAQIRGRVFEGLCRRARSQGRYWRLDRILQSPAAASGAGEPDTDGGLARRRHRRIRGDGCGYDAALGQRCRVAHIPTAATAITACSDSMFSNDGAASPPTEKPAPVVLTAGSTSGIRAIDLNLGKVAFRQPAAFAS